LLHTNNGRFSLRFAGAHPTHLLTRARIRVKGVQTSNTLALGPRHDNERSNRDTGAPD
jgi:hypothetical protein